MTMILSPGCSGRPRHSSESAKIARPPWGAEMLYLSSISDRKATSATFSRTRASSTFSSPLLASSVNDLLIARCRSALAMSSAFTATASLLRVVVSLRMTRGSSATTIWFGCTLIESTTPSTGEVIGNGRIGVISACASALNRTGTNESAAAMTATINTNCFVDVRCSQRRTGR